MGNWRLKCTENLDHKNSPPILSWPRLGFGHSLDVLSNIQIYLKLTLTLSHLDDFIHSQSGAEEGGGFRPLCNFAFLDPNQTKFGVVIVPCKKNIN